MNTAIEQYIRELSDLLCCDKATKQQFLSKFQQTLEDFEAEQENSPISYSDLVSEFDTPRATADAFLSQLDISHVQPAMRTTNKKKIFWASLCVIAILFLVGLSLYRVYLNKLADEGYFDPNPMTLFLTSLLNPMTTATAIIITANPMAIPAIAMRTAGRETCFPPSLSR